MVERDEDILHGQPLVDISEHVKIPIVVVPECAGRMRAACGTTRSRLMSWRREIDAGARRKQIEYCGALLRLRKLGIVVDGEFGQGPAWIDRAAADGLAIERAQDR